MGDSGHLKEKENKTVEILSERFEDAESSQSRKHLGGKFGLKSGNLIRRISFKLPVLRVRSLSTFNILALYKLKLSSSLTLRTGVFPKMKIYVCDCLLPINTTHTRE